MRARGIPCYYAPLIEGYRAWASAMSLMKHLSGIRLEAAYEYINWYHSGWEGGFIAKQGYYSPVPENAKKFMTEDESIIGCLEWLVCGVQVRAAYSAAVHLHHKLVGAWFRPRHIFNGQGLSGMVIYSCFQCLSPVFIAPYTRRR